MLTVMSCQGRGRTYKFFTASRMADRFRDVDKKIDSYLSLIPTISYICITSRLDANHTTSRSQSQLVLVSVHDLFLCFGTNKVK